MKSRFLFLFILLLLLSQGSTAQWYVIPELQYAAITCLMVTNDSTVFVGGHQGLLLRSTDAGRSWENVWGANLGDTVLSLGSGDRYLYAGTFGVSSVHRSTDNGTSWNVSNTGLPGSMVVRAFNSTSSKLFVAGNTGVFSSTDWGGQWRADTVGLRLEQPYPGYEFAGNSGITSVGSVLYTIKRDPGGVYTSPEDTVAWIPIGLDNNWGYAIVVLDTNVIAGTRSGVFLYTGSGSTWIPRNSGLPGFMFDCLLTVADSLIIAFIAGYTESGVYVTSDLGEHWIHVDIDDFAGMPVHAMITTNEDVIVGTEMGAWRKPIAEILTSVGQGSNKIPTTYALFQNFPNPFNPSTTITFSLPQECDVLLRVYSILGEEVATLVNSRKHAGTHSVEWKATAYPSGVYFYMLATKEATFSGKLLLIR